MNTAEARVAWINSLINSPIDKIQQETEQLLIDLIDIVEQTDCDFEYNVILAHKIIREGKDSSV